MKVQTALLTSKALNWAVQACEFKDLETNGSHIKEWAKSNHIAGTGYCLDYSADWACAGPIIERADIAFRKYHKPDSEQHGTYYAKVCRESGQIVQWSKRFDSLGPTALVASMRCYVRSRLGDEVEVPDSFV